MGSKHKIILSLSFVLALFYSLPWIALSEQVRMAGYNLQNVPVVSRVLYLFISIFLTSFLFFQYNFFWKYKWRWKERTPRLLVNLFVNLVLVILVCFILTIVSNQVFNIRAARAYFTFYLFRNTSVAIIVMLVTYVVELVEKLRQEKIEVLMLQHQNSETALAALRSQIDPHFLFNTLTTLSSLIRLNSKDTIAFVDHMADTFRYMLEKREHKLVTVKDELHFLKSYLFMMKKRFGDGIQVSINIDDALLEKNIPQFALQIGVENATKHNVVSPKHILYIEIFSSNHAITIRNNLQEKKSGTGYGIGLTNLSQRYHLISKKDILVRKNDQFFELDLPLL